MLPALRITGVRDEFETIQVLSNAGQFGYTVCALVWCVGPWPLGPICHGGSKIGQTSGNPIASYLESSSISSATESTVFPFSSHLLPPPPPQSHNNNNNNGCLLFLAGDNYVRDQLLANPRGHQHLLLAKASKSDFVCFQLCQWLDLLQENLERWHRFLLLPLSCLSVFCMLLACLTAGLSAHTLCIAVHVIPSLSWERHTLVQLISYFQSVPPLVLYVVNNLSWIAHTTLHHEMRRRGESVRERESRRRSEGGDSQ